MQWIPKTRCSDPARCSTSWCQRASLARKPGKGFINTSKRSGLICNAISYMDLLPVYKLTLTAVMSCFFKGDLKCRTNSDFLNGNVLNVGDTTPSALM